MNKIENPKFWANVCAWMVPVSILGLSTLGFFYCWTISEIGTIIAAIAGSLAGLAGFLYVYATFKQQNDHFKFDQNNQMYFRLLNSFTLIRDRMTYFNKLNPKYKNRQTDGDFAFKEILEFLKIWATHQEKGWPSLNKEKFEKRGNDYEFIEYQDGFSFENASKPQIEFLLNAVGDQETLGAYQRAFINIIKFCQKEELGDYLQILESHMGKNERVYLHYFCSFFLEPDLIIFLISNKFLLSVSKKHLIHPNHDTFLYQNKEIYKKESMVDMEIIGLDRP